MIGFLKNIFSDGHVAHKAADGLYNGIDNMFYTDEEKAVASHKILEWQLEMAKATAPQNKSRRGIAWIVVGVWSILILDALLSHLFGATEHAKFALELLKEIVLNPFSIIIGFYFLSHVVKGIKK